MVMPQHNLAIPVCRLQIGHIVCGTVASDTGKSTLSGWHNHVFEGMELDLRGGSIPLSKMEASSNRPDAWYLYVSIDEYLNN